MTKTEVDTLTAASSSDQWQEDSCRHTRKEGYYTLQLVHTSPTILCIHLVIVYLILQVFLDEVNTSSCMGLMKEIVVDGTMNGEVSQLALWNTVEPLNEDTLK